MSIEIEIRGIISKEEFDKAKTFLDEKAESKQIDDRETYFFIVPKLNLKVAKAISKNSAKIALKTGEESAIASRELEISIKPEEVETAVEILKNLGFDKYKRSDQLRTNYTYKSCEISMKWSQDWNYHFEMEFVTEDSKQIENLRLKLEQIAAEVGLKPMSEEEISYYITNLRKQQGLI